MTDNANEVPNESSSPSSNSSTSSLTAENLVSPNTEKAVDELINSNQQRSAIISRASTQQTSIAATGTSSSSNDDFENLQKAVQILGKAKQLDESKKYDEALKLYRQGVDMLLEELIIRQGTDSSRSYLRDKCNDFMNRIDQLKLIIQIEKASADNKENQTQQQVNSTS